ncbi:20849_t:CDS:2, partial [Dentiscutata erythropus]
MFEEREKSLELLQKLYDSMKEDSQLTDMNMQQQTMFYNCSNNNDFFEALENKVSGSASEAEEDKKYLLIPAIFVPSERLFSTTGNYIFAKYTQLSLDLVNQ